MKKEIALFGFGHLAQFLKSELYDFKIYATKTSKTLNEDNISIHSYCLGEKIPNTFPKKLEAVIWMIPPRDKYLESLKKAEAYFAQSVPWFFISSTSVYKAGEIDEASARDGETQNAKQLICLEDYLKSLSRKVSILRPGGLVDEQRHPARFLSQKEYIDNGESLVNLVHCMDVAKFISYLIKNPQYIGEDYNLVSETHLTKQDYYSTFLKKYYNRSPVFKNESLNLKRVKNKKSKSIGFSYQYPNVDSSHLKLFTT